MSAALQEALNYEAKEAVHSIQDMMEGMLQNVKDNDGYVREELDEMTIRKMMLAKHYLKQDIEKMKEMKKAIVKEWDQRINKKNDDIAAIDSIIDNFVKHQNNGKKLSFDIGTASLRRNNHKVTMEDENKAKAYFQNNGVLQEVLKEPSIDVTRAQNYFMIQFEQHVKSLAEATINQEIQMSEKKKITKKREKEILQETIDRELPNLQQNLPEGFKLIMPEEKVTTRFNI
ncbi:hypothetical protein [Virgibacillus salexigens]|uniref:Uncharacterized protein n=1 Tax=Virgibacillus massiliensis TaxID=1462526 RepID=A0A024QI49_9BACI|nr:hypothetical protein [Virgibacillus massiliensis]CDQ41907.1 hypothetical protein BN990_04286 [Virgibacillus massiliensis]